MGAILLSPSPAPAPPNLGPPPGCSFLAVSPDGKYALTLTRHYSLDLWNLVAKKREWTASVGGDWTKPKRKIYFGAFVNKGKSILAWGANDETVRILDTTTGKITRTFPINYKYGLL